MIWIKKLNDILENKPDTRFSISFTKQQNNIKASFAEPHFEHECVHFDRNHMTFDILMINEFIETAELNERDDLEETYNK